MKKIRVSRLFTVQGEDPYRSFEWEDRYSEIRDPDGKIRFQMDGVRVPSSWSRVATDILAQKYFRRRGVPNKVIHRHEEGIPHFLCPRQPAPDAVFGGETDARQVFDRMAGCWAYWAWKGRYFESADDANSFYDEIRYMLAAQIAAPNTPQWLNTGLHWAYGIETEAPGYWYACPVQSPDTNGNAVLVPSSGLYHRPSSMACYILGLEDNLLGQHGISEWVKREARIFRVGAGSGCNISSLRGEGEPLSGGGKSSGAVSFAKIADANAGAIKSGGTSRRAAKMLVMDADHPDIEEYIGWKVREQNKVAAMAAGSKLVAKHAGKMLEAVLAEGDWNPDPATNRTLAKASRAAASAGVPKEQVANLLYRLRICKSADDFPGFGLPVMDVGWQSEAYQTVSGQNANNSIRVSNTFMRLAEGGRGKPHSEDWPLYWRTELEKAKAEKRKPKPCRHVSADRLWRAVAEAAWWCADPGVQFDTTINEWNTCAADGKIKASNPCCLVGETTCETSHGKLSIEELVDHFDGGGTLPEVVSWDGGPVLRKVKRAWCSGCVRILARVKTSGGTVVTCTPEHRFLTASGDYVPASSLSVGTFLQSSSQERVVRVEVFQTDGPVPVYDLEVEGAHNFSVGDGGPPVVVHNSEYHFLDDTACNLASINLLAFQTPRLTPRRPWQTARPGDFDVRSYRHTVRLWTFVLETTVLMGQFPSQEVAANTWRYRTLGIGYANLGSLLACCGLPYGSANGRAIAAAMTAIMHFTASETSAHLAAAVGPCAAYEKNREHFLRVFRNHARAAGCLGGDYEKLSILPQPLDLNLVPGSIADAVLSSGRDMLKAIETHGMRNSQISLIAPTGTIGLIMDCSTTGVEPDYCLVKFKSLAGGGYFRIVNDSIREALAAVGYSPDVIDQITLTVAGRGTFVGCPHVGTLPTAWKHLDQAVALAEWQAKLCFHVRMAFTRHVLGEELWREALAVGDAEGLVRVAASGSLLDLYLTDEQIAEVDAYVCGLGHLEDLLPQEHLAIFDCANRCGRTGKRFISPEDHIRMLGAVQPFLSGSCSKTINCPPGTTVEQVRDMYNLTWELMVKCSAVYRGGSKFDEPLSSGSDSFLSAPVVEAAEKVATKMATTLLWGSRKKLPDRRKGYTQKARIGGNTKLFVRTGEYEDGTLGEIFLDMHKEGAAFRAIVNQLAMAVSIGLQYGVPLEKFVDAFVWTKFEPNGIVQGNNRIKMATSIVDYIFRELAITYLGRGDLANVEDINTEDMNPTATREEALKVAVPETFAPVVTTRPSYYVSDPCMVCGNLTQRRTGTCLTCETCGTNSGCG